MSFRKVAPHIVTILIVAALILTQQVWAAPLAARMAAPSGTSKTTIAYQGYLTDSANSPVNGALEIVFKLYNVESGGTALWSETQPAVSVTDGLFSVLLGSVTPLSSSLIADNSDLWLGITIGSDTEMAPRDKLASAPYAMMADVPDGSITQYKLGNDSVTSAKIVDGAVSSSDAGFNYAASTSKGGAATDLACTNCVAGSEIADGQVATADLADNAVTSAKVTDGAVGSNDVGFNYATSASKGGAATDLACTNCVSNSEIQDGQVVNADLADNAVTSAKITDGTVSSADVSFNYANSTNKGGAASDVACSGCISASDVAGSSISQDKFAGVRLYTTALQVAVDANGQGCVTFSLPSGRFTDTPEIFAIRRSLGGWEDNADYAKTKFIETTARNTTSATICLDDDQVVSGTVGIGILAVQAN